MTVIGILKKVPIFQLLTVAGLEQIEKLLTGREVRNEEHVFFETDTGSEFYIVNEGRIKIYKMSAGGQIKALDYLEKGDFFGEMALLDQSPRSANAVAVCDSTLLTVKYSDFQELMTAQPDILMTITKTLCSRLRKVDREIELFAFSDVKDRLLLCLINLAEKYGEEEARGILLPANFTHQDLSELVGTAREVVSRILKDLRSEGLILAVGRSIIVPSVSGLRRKITV